MDLHDIIKQLDHLLDALQELQTDNNPYAKQMAIDEGVDALQECIDSLSSII